MTGPIGSMFQMLLARTLANQDQQRLLQQQQQMAQPFVNAFQNHIPTVNVSPQGTTPPSQGGAFNYGGNPFPTVQELAPLAAKSMASGFDPTPWLNLAKDAQPAAPPKQDEYTLSEGQQRYRGGQMIASGPAKQDTPEEFGDPVPLLGGGYGRFGKRGGFVRVEQGPAPPRNPNQPFNPDGTPNPAFQQYQERLRTLGRNQINIDQREFGPIPPGYRRMTGADGSISMVPIPGSPAAREIEEADRKASTQKQQRGIYADVVTEDIGRAIDIIENATIPVTGPGSILSQWPGSSANDVRALINTVKSNVGFDRLQAMRDASPTGGALGQVAIPELTMLQAAVGSLEQSQSQGQLLFNLQRVQEIYNLVVHGTTALASSRQSGPPAGVPADVWQAMTPEERALWK